MSDLIYVFDGGGRWVLGFAILLVLCVASLWLCLDDRSPMWEEKDDDEDNDWPDIL